MPECDTGPLNKKNIENVFYFKEKPYLCNPKQTITQQCPKRESDVTNKTLNNNNKKYILK